METFEYKIVTYYDGRTVEDKINRLAKEGFVVKFAQYPGNGDQLFFLLERKVMPAHPFR